MLKKKKYFSRFGFIGGKLRNNLLNISGSGNRGHRSKLRLWSNDGSRVFRWFCLALAGKVRRKTGLRESGKQRVRPFGEFYSNQINAQLILAFKVIRALGKESDNRNYVKTPSSFI